jgi:mono/diheme cytochrome c family protein
MRGTTRRLAALVGLTLTSWVAGTTLAADPPPYITWSRTPIAAAANQPRGYVQFQSDCAVCHGPGPEKPGTRALAAKYKGSLPAMLEERRDLTPDLIKVTVRHGLTVMPPFRKTELSDPDLEAIVAYLTRKRP